MPYLGDDTIHLNDLVDEAAEELARREVVGAKLADEGNVHTLARTQHLAQGAVRIGVDVIQDGVLKRGDGFSRIVDQAAIEIAAVVLFGRWLMAP